MIISYIQKAHVVNALDSKPRESLRMAGASRSPGSTPRQIPYSRLSVGRRRWLVALLGYVTLASSLTATIYLPIIELLSQEYSSSIQEINLTITLYVVLQALSPALFAPASETLGRRPVLLASFVIYVAASLGLSFGNNGYAALLVLRGLQSLGGSAVMSLAYGVVADVITPAERGSMLGPLLAATNVGPCIGPVVGGLIARETGGSQWCFRALAIFGGVALVTMGFTLPETCRSIVGNGAVKAKGPWRTWWDLLAPKAKSDELIHQSESSAGVNEGKSGKGTFSVPNPLAPVRIVLYRDTFLTLWVSATVYSVWYAIQASIPMIFGSTYHWNELWVGLSYLAGGSGVILGGFAAGKLMDRNYQYTAKRAGITIDRVAGDNMDSFPIERARSKGSIMLFAFYICALVGYGWCVSYTAHPSIPLILQFIIGAEGTIIHQSFNALLVDIFPQSPSIAAAAGNITRCSMAAAVVACVSPLIHVMGYGWFFTLLGFLSGFTGISAVKCLCSFGRKWRQTRLGRNECIDNDPLSVEKSIRPDTKAVNGEVPKT